MKMGREMTTKWTPQELERLRQLAASERSLRSIARIMGRSEAAVRGKAHNNGILLQCERGAQRLPLRFEMSLPSGS
jgi:hypothetical protein